MAEARPRWLQAVYFVAGIAAMAALGWVAMRVWPREALPDGWMRIAPPHDVMALAEIDGEIWSGGRDGLVVIDRETGQLTREIKGDVPFEYVTDIVVSARDGAIWISHMRGLSRYDGGAWQTLTTADGLTGGRAMALVEAPDGDLWVGTEQGVTRLWDGAAQRFTKADGLMTEGCAHLFLDSHDRLWCGNGRSTEAGASVLEDEVWGPMPDFARLGHPMLNAVLETGDGTLWFGTGFSAEGALSIIDDGMWRTLTKDDGLAGAKVQSLFQDDAGVIWASSEYNGTTRMAADSWQIITPEEGLAGWEVMAALQDSRGNLWLGTELGLTRLSHAAWLALGD